MGVTIKQIAADLKLAISTVSKALSDSHEISPETKARVFEYAERMEYKPNPYASGLKDNRSRNIAVVLPEIADSFFASAIDGIEAAAQTKGYHVMIYLTHEDAQREHAIISELRHRRVDGVLISVVSNSSDIPHLQGLYEHGVPVVFFDRVHTAIDTANVVTNDFDSAYSAASLLIRKGCKRITFLALRGDLNIIKDRTAGYLKAINDHGIDTQLNPVLTCGHQEDETMTLIRQRLTQEDSPDGVICSSEKLTTQTYSVCHRLKISIPEDIKIIGFSHLPIASLLRPSLTTVTQPAFEMGRTAATLLLNALDKKRTILKKESIVLPSMLIERDSTG